MSQNKARNRAIRRWAVGGAIFGAASYVPSLIDTSLADTTATQEITTLGVSALAGGALGLVLFLAITALGNIMRR